MASSLSDYQLQRESDLLLRRLKDGRGYVQEIAGTGLWHLFTRRTGFTRPAAEIDASFIEALRKAQLLVPRPGGGLMATEVDARKPSTVRFLAQIDRPLAEAADRLARDYECAQFGARVTSNWDPALGATNAKRAGAERELSNATLVARDYVHAALAAAGPQFSRILCEVCCLSAGIEQAERRLGLPRRSGRGHLLAGLRRLAHHYGFTAAGNERRVRPMRHSGLPDFRPTLEINGK